MSDPRFDRHSCAYEEIVNRSVRVSGFDSAYFAARKVGLVRTHSLVSPRANDELKILDVGCGVGLSEPLLEQAFPRARITAVDTSEKSIQVARESRRGLERTTFRVWDSRPNPGEAADIIFMAGVLHHVPVSERQTFLDTVHDRLSTDGVLFLFEHNPRNPFTRRIVQSCCLDDTASLLSDAEARDLLRRSGFVRQSLRYIFFFPAWLRFLMPLEHRLSRIPLGAQYCIAAQ